MAHQQGAILVHYGPVDVGTPWKTSAVATRPSSSKIRFSDTVPDRPSMLGVVDDGELAARGVPEHAKSRLNRIEPLRASAAVQYARNASLPCTTGDPVTTSAVGLAKMMSSRKCASTASTSRRFQASAHSSANFSAFIDTSRHHCLRVRGHVDTLFGHLKFSESATEKLPLLGNEWCDVLDRNQLLLPIPAKYRSAQA